MIRLDIAPYSLNIHKETKVRGGWGAGKTERLKNGKNGNNGKNGKKN